MLNRLTFRGRIQHVLGFPILFAVGVWVTPSWGQSGITDSVQHRNNCRLARQVLVHGQPSNKRDWALSYFLTCGAQGGTIVRDVLLRHRADAAFDAELDRLVSAATGLVDGQMASTALQIASDRTAGGAARVQAMRVLYGQIVPWGNVSYERIVRSGDSASTDAAGNIIVAVEPLDAGGGHGPIHYGAPLSDAEIARIGEAIGRVAEDSGDPAAVRTAAAHVAQQYRIYSICPRGTPAVECVRRFRDRHNQR